MRYLLTAIAGAIVVILGFIGTMGSNVENIWITAISLFPIFAGLIGGGVSLAMSTWVSREDFKISVASFLEAMENDAIHLFTDTASGRDRKLHVLFLSWLISFLLFSCGAVWFGISILLLDFKVEQIRSDKVSAAEESLNPNEVAANSGTSDSEAETDSSQSVPSVRGSLIEPPTDMNENDGDFVESIPENEEDLSNKSRED